MSKKFWGLAALAAGAAGCWWGLKKINEVFVTDLPEEDLKIELRSYQAVFMDTEKGYTYQQEEVVGRSFSCVQASARIRDDGRRYVTLDSSSGLRYFIKPDTFELINAELWNNKNVGAALTEWTQNWSLGYGVRYDPVHRIVETISDGKMTQCVKEENGRFVARHRIGQKDCETFEEAAVAWLRMEITDSLEKGRTDENDATKARNRRRELERERE